MLPEEAYFSVQETLTSPPNRTDLVQLFVRVPLPAVVEFDRVGNVGVSEADRDGFEGKRPSP